MATKNRIVLQLDPSPRNARNSEATFVTLKNGRILLAWSKFIGSNSGDFGAGVIASRYSDDDGQTWSQRDVILVKQEGTTNVMSPSLLRLQDGRIALLYLRKDGDRVCVPYIRFSNTEAKTFSEPVRVIQEPGYYVVNNDRMIQTRSGRIMMPVSFHRYRGPSEVRVQSELPGDGTTQQNQLAEPFMAAPGIIFYYFSDDGGQTWLESLTSYYYCSPGGHGLEEPGVIELNDGRLWSWTRIGEIGLGGCGERQWQSFSSDGGQVWSQPAPSEFVSPCSPMQVKRIPATGHLLAVWNDQSGRWKVPKPKTISWGRTPLACAISKDEGNSWEHHKLLERAPDHGFSYPAMHFTNDGVLLSYNAGGASSKNPLDTQRVRRIPLEEIYV